MAALGDTYGAPPPFDEELAGAPFPPPHWTPGVDPAAGAPLAEAPVEPFPPPRWGFDALNAPASPAHDALLGGPTDDPGDFSGLTGSAPPPDATPTDWSTPPVQTGAFGAAYGDMVPGVHPTGAFGIDQSPGFGYERPSPAQNAPDGPSAPMTPEGKATYSANQGAKYVGMQGVLLADEKERHFADKEEVAAREKIQGQKDALAMREKADAKANQDLNAWRAESDALAKSGTDPNHWMESRSGGQKIAAYFSAIVGGLLSGGKGPNEGLAMIQKAIDDDVETQKSNLGHRRAMLGEKRGAIADMFAHNGDVYRSGESARAAMYESVREQIAAERQKYNPQGTTAQRLAEFEVNWNAGQAAHATEVEEKLHKRALEDGAAELAQKAQAETVRHNKSSDGLGWATQHAADQDRDAGRVLEAAKSGLVSDGKGGWIPDPNKPVDKKGGLELEELEHIVKIKANMASNDDPVTLRGVGGLKIFRVGKDGKREEAPYLARDASTGGKLAENKATADQFAQFVDEITLLRKQKGWSSDLAKSDEWRQLKSKYASALVTWKDTAHLGVLSVSDLELAHAVLGGDPTSLRDPTPGLQTARKSTIDTLNHELDAQQTQPGWRMDRYEPVKLQELVDVERPKAADLDIATKAPVGYAANDPDGAAILATAHDERAKAIAALGYKDRTPAETHAVIESLQRDQAAGKITPAQAAELASRLLAPREEPSSEGQDPAEHTAPVFRSMGD